MKISIRTKVNVLRCDDCREKIEYRRLNDFKLKTSLYCYYCSQEGAKTVRRIKNRVQSKINQYFNENFGLKSQEVTNLPEDSLDYLPINYTTATCYYLHAIKS